MIVPDGEEAYDEAIDMISDTDWSLPTKVLREQCQAKFYAYFGQTVKAQPTPGATAKAEEEKKEGDSVMINTAAGQ